MQNGSLIIIKYKDNRFYHPEYYKEYWLFHFHDWRVDTADMYLVGEILLDKEANIKVDRRF